MTTDNNEENQEELEGSLNKEESNGADREVGECGRSTGENTDSPGFNVGDTVSGTVYKIEDKFVKAHIDDSDFEGIITDQPAYE